MFLVLATKQYRSFLRAIRYFLEPEIIACVVYLAHLFPRPILPLYMLQHIILVKQHVFKLALGVHKGLVGKMRGVDVAAFATGQQAFSLYSFAKFHRANKTVAGYAIPLFGTGKIAPGIGG